jgi:hypothetical protein
VNVLPGAVALSSERFEKFKLEAAQQAAAEQEKRSRYPKQST